MALQIRRGTDAERQSITPAEGELIFTTDTNQLFVGGKIAPSTTLSQGGILVSGALVNDTNPTLSANLVLNGNDITGSGNININGTITATGNIELGDGVEDNIIVGGQIGSSLIPGTGGIYDLGAESARWNRIFAETLVTNAIDVDTMLIKSIDVDTTASVGDLELKNNIILSDSSVFYDSQTGSVNVAQITATGTITADSFIGETLTVQGAIESDSITSAVTNTGSIVVTDGILEIDGSALVDGNLQVTGNISGQTFIGDLVGSVTLGNALYGNDSSVIIDSTDNKLRIDVVNQFVETKSITANGITLTDAGSEGTYVDIVTESSYVDEGKPAVFQIQGFTGTTAESPVMVLSKARGTPDSPAPLQADDELGGMTFFGTDADTAGQLGAAMLVKADGNPTSGIVPSSFNFFTTSSTAGFPLLALKLDSDQTLCLSDKTVGANSGSGTADVTGGVVTYLKIKVGDAGTEYAMPLYGIVP